MRSPIRGAIFAIVFNIALGTVLLLAWGMYANITSGPPKPQTFTVTATTTRLDHDAAVCKAAHMVNCHVETDSDGSQSVYGEKP